jgi:hypothetical protein
MISKYFTLVVSGLAATASAHSGPEEIGPIGGVEGGEIMLNE